MKIFAWCAALLLLVGLAVGLDDASGTRPTGGPPAASRPFALGGVAMASASSLRSFEDCGELLDFFREQASRDQLGAGFGRGGGEEELAFATEDRATSSAGADTATAAPPTPATPTSDESVERATAEADGGAAFSGTNLQEVDVDEPDVVKTDGELIVAVAGPELHVIDPAGPELLGAVPLPADGASDLLLTGDGVTVLTRSWGPMVDDATRMASEMVVGGPAVTILTTVDISDPRAPRVLETRSFEGDYASARMTGTLVRLVLRSSPQLGVPEPRVLEEGLEGTTAWAEDAIEAAPLDAWLPNDDDGPLVACDAVARPAEPSGTSTITVLTIDVGRSLEPQDATAVVADAETVYASTDRLYVATTRWGQGCCDPGMPMPVEGDGGIGDTEVAAPTPAPVPEPVTTDVHAFDTSGPTTPYLGSGRVEGRLLNSFSLSEHEGILRVATTIDPFDGVTPSESAVTTLAEEGGALVERGRLAGLGTTEQIYAVRYQGDVGYLVTFRQTDPLYTIDLSDPAAPRLLGELKIPGYSSYLHPAEAGRLIGVGQDATEEGRTQGSQVSTFDVSDLAAPTEEDRLSFPDGYSPVEYEHRAFLWWAPERVAVVPMEVHPFDEVTGQPEGEPFAGAVAVDVGADGSLSERGRVSHTGRVGPERYASISRSLVIGDTLYTLSEAGLLASDLSSLADLGWLPL